MNRNEQEYFSCYHTETDFGNLLDKFVNSNLQSHVKTLLHENPLYNVNRYYNDPLLKVAIRNCNPRIVRMLLDRDINIDDHEYWIRYCNKLLNLPDKPENIYWKDNKKELETIKILLDSENRIGYPIFILADAYKGIDDVPLVTKEEGNWDGVELFDQAIGVSDYIDRFGEVIENNIFSYFSTDEYFEGVKQGILNSYRDYRYNLENEEVVDPYGILEEHEDPYFAIRRLNFE